MVFSPSERQLQIVAALVMRSDGGQVFFEHPEQPVSTTAKFDYGDGIAGRAFKTNEIRFYVKTVDKPRQPDYYRQILGQRPHSVLLSMPLRNPQDSAYAYGVINFASIDPTCPLREFATSPAADVNGLKLADALAHFQTRVNQLFYEELSEQVSGT